MRRRRAVAIEAVRLLALAVVVWVVGRAFRLDGTQQVVLAALAVIVLPRWRRG